MKLLITIDTEPDCDIHWNRSHPSEYTSIINGIPDLLRPIWDRCKVNPIYFVSPDALDNDESCAILKNEIKLGAIIGTHLHSEFIEPNITKVPGKPSAEFPCFAHSNEIEFEKLKNFTNLIEEKLGVKPEWYRAARFGADLDTIRSLKKLGYKYDSSVTPEIDWSKGGGPDHNKAPVQPYWISKDDYYKGVEEKDSIGIKEFPVTISGKRFGLIGKLLPDNWLFFNWLRPTHMFMFEQRRLINKFNREFKEPVLVMMFHSMEIMINKSPYVRNKLMQKLFLSRLERTIIHFQKSIE